MSRLIRMLAMVLCACWLAGCALFPTGNQNPDEQNELSAESQQTGELDSSQSSEETDSQPSKPDDTPSTTEDHDAKIQLIRSWYQAIESDPDLATRVYGDAATVYLKDGQIVCIAEYHQLNDAMDPAMETVYYYYHDGAPFFVFIEYENCDYGYDEVRLYYSNGTLIRWILDQNAPNDNISNAQWQSYYEKACDALVNAPTGPDDTPSATEDLDAKIQLIRSWYQAIVSDPNLEAKGYGDAATVYRKNGQIVSITEYHQLNDAMNPAMETVYYYYHDGVPFFVFIEYENCDYGYDEVRLYYSNGTLIRWILDQNAPNDNISNAQWQSYYEKACDAIANVPAIPADSTSSMDAHTAKIRQIDSWHRDIVVNSNYGSKIHNSAVSVFMQDGQIVSIVSHPQQNDSVDSAKEKVLYYYHDGVPFFIFILYENFEYEEVRLFFYDGELIRWVIDQNAPNDNIPNAHWQSYYDKACDILQSAPTGPKPPDY